MAENNKPLFFTQSHIRVALLIPTGLSSHPGGGCGCTVLGLPEQLGLSCGSSVSFLGNGWSDAATWWARGLLKAVVEKPEDKALAKAYFKCVTSTRSPLRKARCMMDPEGRGDAVYGKNGQIPQERVKKEISL